MKLKLSKDLQRVVSRIKKIKKLGHGKGEAIIEIDYFKSNHLLDDGKGGLLQPFMIIFVHRDSYFVMGTRLVIQSEKFLLEFFEQLLSILETSPILIGKIVVKKQELFDLFEKTANDLNIEIEMAKRLSVAEKIKGDITKFVNNLSRNQI
jgi:hypothetical protein